jgi:hypothetical protein
MSKILLSVLVTLLLVVSLAHAEPTPFDQKFNQLQKNMKVDQVKALLGPPDLREVKEYKEIWHYSVN